MHELRTILLLIAMNYIKCKEKGIGQDINSTIYFRLKMEEITEVQTHKFNVKDEFSDDLVSVFKDYAKDMLVNTNNGTLTPENSGHIFDTALLFNTLKRSTTTHNLSLNLTGSKKNNSKPNSNESITLLNIIKDMKLKTVAQRHTTISNERIEFSVINVSALSTANNFLEPGKSCISCNNVIYENCYDPKSKMVPSIVCEREDDLCYSQHTPFGIIDRGCFNINHNLTLFVCACNLCNYISIAEMPYIFSNKRDWIENVIELSRAKRFRESIFKDMSCLSCEVNVTAKTGDIIADANCLEGNVATLPTQVCADNEICAVKAVRSEGYMWRGCVSEPLYNYWWTLCDSDLCNYDSVVSVYDTIQT